MLRITPSEMSAAIRSLGSAIGSTMVQVQQSVARFFRSCASLVRPPAADLGSRRAAIAPAQALPSTGPQRRDSLAAASFARQDGVPPEGKPQDAVVLRAAPKEALVGRAIVAGSAEHFALAKKWTAENVDENRKSGSYLSRDDGFRGDGVVLKDCHIVGYERATKAIPAVGAYLREAAGLNQKVAAIVPPKVHEPVTPEAEIQDMTRFLAGLADLLEQGSSAFLGEKACKDLRELGKLVDDRQVPEGSYLFVRSMVPFRMLAGAVSDAVGLTRDKLTGSKYGMLCTFLGKDKLVPSKVLSGAAGQLLGARGSEPLAEGLTKAFARASAALHVVVNEVVAPSQTAARPESKHAD